MYNKTKTKINRKHICFHFFQLDFAFLDAGSPLPPMPLPPPALDAEAFFFLLLFEEEAFPVPDDVFPLSCFVVVPPLSNDDVTPPPPVPIDEAAPPPELAVV